MSIVDVLSGLIGLAIIVAIAALLEKWDKQEKIDNDRRD